MKTKLKQYNNLARQLVLVITPTMVIIAILFGLSFGAYDRYQERTHIQHTQRVLHQQLANMLSEPLYYFEYRVIDAITKTIIQNDEIKYVHVLDELGNTISTRGPATKHKDILYSKKVIERNNKTPLGTLELGFSVKPTKPILFYYLFPLGIALLLVMLLALMMFLLWQKRVALPLRTIRKAMENNNGDKEEKVNINSNNEFALIADTYNLMLERITTHRLKIEKLANHDQLTGLLNRRAFSKQVQQTIKNSPNTPYWLLFIDLDRFKWINDTYGHISGDKVLVTLSKRLKKTLPKGLISRFGGDEFVIFHPQEIHDGRTLIKQIKNSTNQLIQLDNGKLKPSICIGVVSYPEDGVSYESLLQRADAAMYQAKVLGRDADFFYNNYLDEINKRQLKISGILQTYILQDCLDVYFQPIVNSATNVTISAEALLRLRDQNMSDISIEQFLHIAEESGFIHEIDRISRLKSFAYFCKWKQQNLPIGDIHVNTSPITFSTDHFVDRFLIDLNLSGLKGEEIILEITESTLLNDLNASIKKINKLKKAGVRIAMDDFGTGYSSLSLLMNLPIDIIKFDQVFFRKSQKTEKERELILKHTIAMAKDLKLEIIAEGIEDKESLNTLENHGCHLIQGYIYAKPMTEKHFIQFLSNN